MLWPASPCPISHACFRKHSEVLGGGWGGGDRVRFGYSFGLGLMPSCPHWEGSREASWRLVENSSLTRGRFKFSPYERRHLGSPLWVLYVQGQLGPQQHVAPETQPGSACPSVTTETRYTNNGPRAPGTPLAGRSLPRSASALLT